MQIYWENKNIYIIHPTNKIEDRGGICFFFAVLFEEKKIFDVLFAKSWD